MPLFEQHPTEGWVLNEQVAAPVWNMAKEAMTRAKRAVDAGEFNRVQASRSSATPAPPTVATARSTVTTGHATPDAATDPMIDKRTGKPYADPWDAIRRAI
jgi:hypothetical protein